MRESAVTTGRRRGGFTLIEVLMAASLLAMVMAGVGAAVHASLFGYEANRRIADATQMGRVVLTRMMREVRTAVDVDSTSAELIITPVPAGGLTEIRYEWLGDKLCLHREVNGQTNTYTLIGQDDDAKVTTFHVLREVDYSGTPISITARLELSVGGHAFAMTASGALRKNRLY